MLVANELVPRVGMDDKNIHASVISGKLRVMTFTFKATEDDADLETKKLLIGYLPAGRGRVQPLLSRIKVIDYPAAGMTYTIGLGAYTSSNPATGAVAAAATAISSSITASSSVASFIGATQGVPYQSLDDIPIVMHCSANIPEDMVVEGIIIYNVT